MKIFFNETIEFNNKNIIENAVYYKDGRSGINYYYYTYYYKIITINVIPYIKFIDTSIFRKIDINGTI